jgi:Rhodopirellula transposase DDE domain
MKRLTEFADTYDLEIVLAYYQPYHSTLTPSSTVGGFLKTIGTERYVYRGDTTLEWAKSMTWKGFHPVLELLETAYKKGVSIGKKVFQSIADRITRHPSLPKYCMTIQPQG